MFNRASIVEIFSSVQGEGLHTGQPVTFVRFCRCTMGCKFCDTPQGLCDSETCRIETPPNSAQFRDVENPISAASLNDILSSFDNNTLSVTGGEPLEQADFIAEWLPSQFHHRRILLETNGVHHAGFAKVLPFIHIVSMDIKLPSSCGVRPHWQDHTTFLKMAIAAGKETYVKVVVTADTTDGDIQNAINIMTKANKYIPVFIQPASPTMKFHVQISKERLHSLERLCHAYLPDVRVTQQMHKQWGVL